MSHEKSDWSEACYSKSVCQHQQEMTTDIIPSQIPVAHESTHLLGTAAPASDNYEHIEKMRVPIEDEVEAAETLDGVILSPKPVSPMVKSALRFLRRCDLSPDVQAKPGGHSPLGGFLHIIYLPLLIAYLIFTITPEYNSIPSCCACASASTPKDSWIYFAIDSDCSMNDTCAATVSSQLQHTCSEFLTFSSKSNDSLSLVLSVQSLVCPGVVPGESCPSECLEVSDKWVEQRDYRSSLNRIQAEYRCEGGVGACDVIRTYANDRTRAFTQTLCHYPSLTGLLTRIGAAIGLFNALLVSARVMVRAVYHRISEKRESAGGWADFFRGAGASLVLNYFSLVYYVFSHNVTKRGRYGAQLMMALLLAFVVKPFTVYLVYLLNNLWVPVFFLILCKALTVVLFVRSLYTLVRLEVVTPPTARYDATWRGFFTGVVLNVAALIIFLIKKVRDVRSAQRLSSGAVRLSIDDGSTMSPSDMSTAPPYGRVHTGVLEGAMVASAVLVMGLVLTLLYVFNVWDALSFNFPNVLPPSPRQPMTTSLLQGAYDVGAKVTIGFITYWLCVFLRHMRRPPATHTTRPRGTKLHFRYALALLIVPVLIAGVTFMIFVYNISDTTDCHVPVWPVMISLVCIVPGAMVALCGRTRRQQVGGLTAEGILFTMFGGAFWMLAFDYCFGLRYPEFYALAWLFECLGYALIVCSSLKPNMDESRSTHDLNSRFNSSGTAPLTTSGVELRRRSSSDFSEPRVSTSSEDETHSTT